MKHFTSIQDLGPAGVEAILAKAAAWKGKYPKHLTGKLLGMVFFNPSLRTRASFEAVMARGGGNAVVLEVGNGVWKLEGGAGDRGDRGRTRRRNGREGGVVNAQASVTPAVPGASASRAGDRAGTCRLRLLWWHAAVQARRGHHRDAGGGPEILEGDSALPGEIYLR